MFRASRLDGAIFLTVICFSSISLAQTESATISGKVTDVSGAVIVGAEIQLQSFEHGTTTRTITNNSGIYVLSGVQAGHYNIEIQHPGFRQVNALGLTVNVQDRIVENFQLQVGSSIESVTITAEAPLVNTEDATVSTVVDRQFAENLPMNGRSFQTLVDLTPGVVLTSSTQQDSGQFSVNGQRAVSNYWMVDGVSANVGISSSTPPGNGVGGAVGSFSALGGTNSLVSVDALQEFRVQTSTYAPEFGRTPGAQISIVTRSGTNQFHGTAFDYFRNDVLDAGNWFNGFQNNPPLPKAKERQNDFGGTFDGPILRDRTFFFFSYEGLRLRLPQTTLTTVPDLNARNSALPSIQPFLKAFPFDPTQPDLGNGIAQFNASYSNPASLDAYSLRIDHKLNDKWSLFGRYNYSPSRADVRGPGGFVALSDFVANVLSTLTATFGATTQVSSKTANEFRINYSRSAGDNRDFLDTFGGAIPISSFPFPNPYTFQDATIAFGVFSLQGGILDPGFVARNVQHQLNIVDNLSIEKGSHTLKFGGDFRRMSPANSRFFYAQEGFFQDLPSAEQGASFFASLSSNRPTTLLLRNLGAFAQDTWRLLPRLTLTYGLRWDVDFAPSALEGPNLLAVSGFNLNDLSALTLAPAGASPFTTRYGNLAPRVGLAYQVHPGANWRTVIRGGFGVFYDLATSEVGNLIAPYYPFGANENLFGVTFPLNPPNAAPPPITPASLASPNSVLFATDPNLKLPYTLQWDVSIEESLGAQQTISASYVGAAGRRLIQTAQLQAVNASIATADLVTNRGRSDYDALQLQFKRRLLRGFQALASYTWSHSIDDASAGSYGNASNAPGSGSNPDANRGPSDFDIRHAFSAGLSYDLKPPGSNRVADALMHGWSLDTVLQARSAPPVDVYGFFPQLNNGFAPNVRPDLVPGIPLYLYGPQYPGGKIFNDTPGQGGTGCVGPFCPEPVDPATGLPLREGNLSRNALRAFRAVQWDFAVHRDFAIKESLKLQFRAELFNVLNHPNFGPPDGNLSDAQFGRSTQMLGQSLGGGNIGQGALSSLYQIGGPRSAQLALKFFF